MPTPITIVTKELTYNCPDTIYSQLVTAGDTATITYTGPDKMWIMVDDDTHKISLPGYTTRDDGDTVPVPPGMTKIKITADDQDGLIILSLIDIQQTSKPVGYTESEESLPDGRTVLVHTPIMLNNIHDLSEMTYDFDNSSWTMPLRSSPTTWQDLLNARNGALTSSDGRIAPDMPDALKQQWMDYRKALRDFPTVFGYGTDNEQPAWKASLPMPPVE